MSKLIHNETREQGIKELKSLISLNQTSVNLRIWLSVLSENREKSFEGEALIIGFILNQYKKNLIDPIDKIPSLDKTIFRVIEILRKFFKVYKGLSRMTLCLSKWPAKNHGFKFTKAAWKGNRRRSRKG